eukprot:1302644-Rhodomonas_salina.2
MLSSAWHGGPAVELFSAAGSKGSAVPHKASPQIKKVFDKSSKGYVLELEGGREVKVSFPASDKDSLGLLQRYLVLQVLVPAGRGFSVELCVTDRTKTRRRINLSSNNKDLTVTPLHVRCVNDMPARILIAMPVLTSGCCVIPEYPWTSSGSIDRHARSEASGTDACCAAFRRGVWVNLCIDVVNLFMESFRPVPSRSPALSAFARAMRCLGLT